MSRRQVFGERIADSGGVYFWNRAGRKYRAAAGNLLKKIHELPIGTSWGPGLYAVDD